MHKVTPHLWFDKEAKEAAEFYASVFPNSKVTHSSVLRDTPSGDCDVLAFEIDGQPFMAISAGPYFKINPSISFLLNFDPARWPDAKEKIDALWASLIEGGNILMPLQEYPFSKYYGWVADKFGVTWQLMLTKPEGEPRPFVTPSLLFTQEKAGQANDAIDFYTSVFKGKRGTTARYPEGSGPDAGNIMYADFNILDTWLAAMDSSGPHKFSFNEGVSLLVQCDDQAEMDRYFDALSADPKSEQCGWLKDKFGVSWQISSSLMQEMMATGTPEQVARVTKAFLPMKRLDIATIRRAFDGE